MKKILLSLTASSLLLFGAYDDNGTDYTNAITQSFTEEDTLSSLNTVNMILSFMQQSRAGEFLNDGNYTALVKEISKEGTTNNGQSATVESLTPMILNVTGRTIPTDPMVVQMWMDIKGPGDIPMRIIGRFNITKGVTPQYALGQFNFNFKGYGINTDDSTNFGDNKIQGVMSVDRGKYNGQVEVQYKNSMNDENNNSSPFEVLNMNMQVNAVDTNVSDEYPAGHFDYEKKGRGVAFSQYLEYDQNGNPTPKAKILSFKDTAYKLADTDGSNPEAYNKNSKEYKVYRYGLFYDSNGSKVDLNSGFAFNYDGGQKYGYAGYYGVWSEQSLPNGTTVKKEGTQDTFTTTSVAGKLWKNTKTGILMSELDGTKIFYNGFVLKWDNDASRNGTTGNFLILGEDNNLGGFDSNDDSGKYIFDQNESNTTNTNISSANLQNIGEWSKGWSEVLNAPLAIRSTYRSDTNASYHTEELVTGTDLNLTSFSFERVNTDNAGAATPVLMYDQTDSNFTIGRSYKFVASEMMLRDRNASDANVTIATDVNLSGTQYEYGVRMSPLIEESSAGAYNSDNFWSAFDADVFYTWETGHQEWNTFTGLKDSNGDVVSFDPPMVFMYNHTQDKDKNNDASIGIYALSYDGFSIETPWVYNTEEEEWEPKINIISTTELTKDGTSYRIKVLDEGIRLGDVTDNDADDLVFDANRNSYAGPDFNGTDLNIEKPTDAPVAVIKGECVDNNCSIPSN